jgi:micrococcal nuclease
MHLADVPAVRRVALGVALVCCATSCGAVRGLSGRRPSDATHATVEHVVDGDTVDLTFSTGTERVRLLGIDTPETVKPNTPVQCFGPEASARTKALLAPGVPVRVTRDAEARDRYGRLLLYVYRSADGMFVNQALVVEGYARILSIAPNTAHAAELSASAASARRAGRGLWSRCAPPAVPP